MDTLQYIKTKFLLDLSHSPVEIPNFGRVKLCDLFRELNFTIGAEVGVFKGAYSEQLCQANPYLKLYCIDPWEVYDDASAFANQTDANSIYQEALKRVSKYDCRVIRKYSIEASREFADDSLDFVYIDGDHRYEKVLEDISAWRPKVRTGGIIAGHDYIRYSRAQFQVRRAVLDYVKKEQIAPWFLLGTYADKKREHLRTWMWVE